MPPSYFDAGASLWIFICVFSHIISVMADFDVVIVGAGPAGLTAAIYAVRRALRTALVERMGVGGQMLLTSEIGNWPGDKLVSGIDLSVRMEEHAKSLGAIFIFDEARGIEHSTEEKKIILRDKEITCKAVILATGGQHKSLKIPGEEEFKGRGVSYCATCDAPFFKGKPVAVLGGANMALEDSIYLSSLASKTYVISDKFTCEEVLLEKAEKSNVEILIDEAEEIMGSSVVEKIRLKSQKTLEVSGVFVSAGTKPSTELASESGIKLDERGFIEVTKNMETNIPGVYAAGDVTGGIPQISTAVGNGATAALKAYGYIKQQEKNKVHQRFK
jgi:thioredoxin reductase (NADPH)